MNFRRLCLFAILVVTLTTNSALAIGFRLSESKKELRLDYDISVTDHKNGKVSFDLAIRDPGRLTELSAVNLMIPDGSGQTYDLVIPVASRQENEIKHYHFQISKDLAQRGQLHLTTHKLDGKIEPLTWYFFEIVLKDNLKSQTQQTKP